MISQTTRVNNIVFVRRLAFLPPFCPTVLPDRAFLLQFYPTGRFFRRFARPGVSSAVLPDRAFLPPFCPTGRFFRSFARPGVSSAVFVLLSRPLGDMMDLQQSASGTARLFVASVLRIGKCGL
jgi:hypothetical protein